MKASRTIAWIGAFTLVCAGLLWAPRAVRADGLEAIQTIKLLADSKTMAVQLKDDAAKMQQFGQMDIQWEAHAVTVAQLKDHVVATKELVNDLKAAEATAVPWERTVIDRIGPYMTALATDNEDVIDTFDEHPSLFGTPAAKAYLAANAESAAYLSALVQNFLQNGTLRQTIQDYDAPEDSCGLTGLAHPAFGMVS
jgi:hypothetical protein